MPNRRGRKQKEGQAQLNLPQDAVAQVMPATAMGGNDDPSSARQAPFPKRNGYPNKAVVVAKTEPEDSFDRATLFTKTKMCKFHLLGLCAKGSNCMYAHDASDLNNLPDLFRTKLCKFLITTGQCHDPDCKYAHNKDELRSTSQLRKTKMCKFWLEGRCELGDMCSYAHDPAELNRTPQTLDTVPQQVGFRQQRGPAGGGYGASPQMAAHKAPMPTHPSSDDSSSPRQVMVVDAKTGKPLIAGMMKTGDANGSIHVMPANLNLQGRDAGTTPQRSEYSPLLSQQLQQELHDPLTTMLDPLDPVKIGLTASNFRGGQFGGGLSPSTSASSVVSSLQLSPGDIGQNRYPDLSLSPRFSSESRPRMVSDRYGDHRPQPSALGQPKVVERPLTASFGRNLSGLDDSPLRGSPLRSPNPGLLSTPELMGVNGAPLDIWGCSDPVFAFQLPVQIDTVSGGDWVVRNTFVETDEPRRYPLRPVASCMGRFESLAQHGSSNSLTGFEEEDLQAMG